VAPPVPAGEDAKCDPDQPFVFAHPEVAEPLRLTDCEAGSDGPVRLAAPPLTNALIELVQRHLRDLGYRPGPADGLVGPRTRDAVRRFEGDQGDEPTGAIDFRLLEQIRSAAAAIEKDPG
jgi:peptidoglycan hydrolase-like protein with peptidoglycan-binding domain